MVVIVYNNNILAKFIRTQSLVGRSNFWWGEGGSSKLATGLTNANYNATNCYKLLNLVNKFCDTKIHVIRVFFFLPFRYRRIKV